MKTISKKIINAFAIGLFIVVFIVAEHDRSDAFGGFSDIVSGIGDAVGELSDSLDKNLKDLNSGDQAGEEGITDTQSDIPSTPEKSDGEANTIGSGEGSGFLKNGKVYKGYSEDFQPIKRLIYAGKLDVAINHYENGANNAASKHSADQNGKVDLDAQEDTNATAEKPLDSKSGEELSFIGMDGSDLKTLNNMELGALKLEANRTDESLEHLEISLKELKMSESAGYVSSGLKTGVLFAMETISGNEELQPYEPSGYEKVMLLNYKAIAYLLNGQDEAFNVARRATDWQNREREEFNKRLEEEKKQLAEEEKKVNDQAASSEQEGGFSGMGEIKEGLAGEYGKYDKIADRVASAYVNPFADYLRGAVMEYKAQADSSKLDDAKRAYEAASKLNPNNVMLRQAAEEMDQLNKSRENIGDGNLLHIVVADGFSPDKKVLSGTVPLPNAIVTLQLPLVEPVANQVKAVKLLDDSDQVLAEMETVADMEAMSLRHQKDSEPGLYLRATLAVARSYLEQQALSNLFGQVGLLVGAVRDQFSHPDTRSWASLPARLFATRLRVPVGTQNIKIATYDNEGRQLAAKELVINPTGHNFVYARSTDETLRAHASKNLWVNTIGKIHASNESE